MRHIYNPNQAGHACAVCGGLATAEEGASHFWTNAVTEPTRPATTVHVEEAYLAAQQRTPDAVPATPTANHAVHTAPDAGDSLTGVRQNLDRLGATGRDTSRTLRDMFDRVGHVGLNV